MSANGWLNLWKPRGVTSHDAVSAVRQALGERRVGHGGTLDPDAEGVLPVAVGATTRLLEWADTEPKVYSGWIELGSLTATGDGAGRVVGESGPPFPSGADLDRAMKWLEGDTLQAPPQVSALKQEGRSLHAWVRAGRSVWPPPRPIHVERFERLAGSGTRFRFRVTVGKGTYVRALARDVGDLLGHAAHLRELTRERAGVFLREEAVPLERVTPSRLWPNARALRIPVVGIDPAGAADVSHGRVRSSWTERIGTAGEVALAMGETVVAVVEGPPWRFLKVLAGPTEEPE